MRGTQDTIHKICRFSQHNGSQSPSIDLAFLRTTSQIFSIIDAYSIFIKSLRCTGIRVRRSAMMADDTLFTLRPLEGKSETLEGAFRVHFHPDDFRALHASLGGPVLLRNQAGKQCVGVAWRSTTAKNRRIINVGHAFRDAFGFSVGDRLSVSYYPIELPTAREVTIDRVSSLDTRVSLGDLYFRARWAMYNLEGLWTGGYFDVPLKSPQLKVRFRIEGIDGQQHSSGLPMALMFDNETSVKVSGVDGEEQGRQTAAQPDLKAVDFGGIGGLEKQLKRLENEIEYMKMLSNSSSSFVRYLEDDHPSRVLLYGPPGTGKTLVLSRIRAGSFRHAERLNLSAKQGTKAEQTIANAFRTAIAQQPSALVVDDIDEIAGRDSDLAHAISAEIDRLGSAQVMIIAAARNRNNINDRLRPKFDCEIELPVPDIDGRLDILRAFRKPDANVPADDLLRDVASMTHGYTGHDLRQLARQAQLDAVTRGSARSLSRNDATRADKASHLPADGDRKSPVENTTVDGPATTRSVTLSDFRSASKLVRPTAMRELFFEAPRVSWSDIGGSDAVKRALWRVVDLPFKHPEIMARSPYRPPRGILLYGPPGCSKTLTAKAIASSSGLNFISIKGAELTSMYVGETERALRDVFRKAQTAAPSVIFFDEIDAIAASREGGHGDGGTPGLNIVTTLLTEMDGMQALRDVLVLAATNRPDVLDPALLRPGRFDTVLYVPPPPLSARRQILAINTRHGAFGALDLDELASKTEGFSGAEIVEVCNRAVGSWTEREAEDEIRKAEGAELRNDEQSTGSSKVSREDFEQALSQVHKVITPEMITLYEEWANQRGDIAKL